MAQSAFRGAVVYNSTQNTISQSISVNTTEGSLRVDGASLVHVHNFAGTNSGSYTIDVVDASDLTVKGELLLTAASNSCNINAAATTNFDATGLSNCPESDAQLNVQSNIDLNGSFAGQIIDDATNENTGDISSGSLTYASVTDWLGFDNFFRGWGSGNSGSETNSSNRGKCQLGDPCSVWDWRLDSADTKVKNYKGATLPCPASISGNDTITDSSGTYTYMAQALEIVRDGIGNDNGLCESNEACIYTPNLGSYQGSGDFYSTQCTFTDGTLSGITMFAYPNP